MKSERHPEERSDEGSALRVACRFLAALGMTAAALGMTAAVLGMTALGMTLLASSASAQTPADTTVLIKANGPVLEFDPPSLFLKEGTRVRVRFTNDGTLPHNVVFVRDEDDIDPLAEAAMREGGDYVPKDMKARMIAFTKLASPGQTVETTFVVPPAGKYMYVCLMSGHANLMLGTLRSLR